MSKNSAELLLIIIIGIVGVIIMIIAFYIPQFEIRHTQTESFELSYKDSKIIPVYLKTNDLLNFYLHSTTNRLDALPLPIISIFDPNERILSIPLIDSKKNDTFMEIYNINITFEGYYKIFIKNTDDRNYKSKRFITFSITIIEPKELDTGALFTVGSILISLTGGYGIGVAKKVYENKGRIPSSGFERTKEKRD